MLLLSTPTDLVIWPTTLHHGDISFAKIHWTYEEELEICAFSLLYTNMHAAVFIPSAISHPDPFQPSTPHVAPDRLRYT